MRSALLLLSALAGATCFSSPPLLGLKGAPSLKTCSVPEASKWTMVESGPRNEAMMDRRSALGAAAAVLFGFPMASSAQIQVIKNTQGKEKSEKKGKGRVKLNNLGLPETEKERPKKSEPIDLQKECMQNPKFCEGKGAWCSCKSVKMDALMQPQE